MIEQVYGDIKVPKHLHNQLERILGHAPIPSNTERLILNCRQKSYYQTRIGVHPVEIQFKRSVTSEKWDIVFFASFSYPDDAARKVEPELYFHLANKWCYQPDTGSVDLSIPEASELLNSWMHALDRHLLRNLFDKVLVTILATHDDQ